MFERIKRLIGPVGLQKIQQANILVVGIGGVGGYALEALVRNGFTHITIIDPDLIEISNCNRQLIATSENINLKKVEEAKKRALSINPNIWITSIFDKINEENCSTILEHVDYVIDACDDITAKLLLITTCLQKKIKIISCMGTGNKTHPEELEIVPLKKTYNDPLAKKIRNKLSKQGKEYLRVPVVWSRELPLIRKAIGTTCSVPMSAGALLASYVLNDIIKE